MLYVIIGLFAIQAALTCYTLFALRDLEKRLKDLEDHLFDV